MTIANTGDTLPLRGERVLVREFVAQDLVPFADYRAIAAVAQFQSWTDYSLTDAQRLFDNMQVARFGTQGHWFQLAICSQETDALLGDLAVHFIDAQQVEVGFTLAPQYQGQGFASEALALLLEYLFVIEKRHRVIAVTDSFNHSAYRMLEKLGFRREAYFEENIFFKGKWGSEFQYAMLSREWSK